MIRTSSFAVSSTLTLFALSLALLATPAPALAQAKFGDAEFQCVSGKQKAAGKYCQSVLKAWSTWDKKGDDAKRDASIVKAASKLTSSWSKEETKSSGSGVDCIDQTVSAGAMAATIDAATTDIVAEINTGLDLANKDDATCGSKLVKAAATQCGGLLKVESKHTKAAPKGGSGAKRAEGKTKASDKFSAAWLKAATCATGATEGDIESRLDTISNGAVYDTAVSPLVDAAEFQPVSFDGLTDTVEYEGRTYTPRCAFDGDEDYHFFVKRGSENKVVMYYQGGGACWENLTCGIPVCKNGADPISDDPDLASTGFADLSNPDNPFRNWNIVFVTYCTCDIHYGDADQTYSGALPDVNVAHRGFSNAKVAEKFARENFLNPDVVMVTGSSAGGYGALFHGGLIPKVWPASEVNVIGDASNGVITPDFLQNEFPNWNFEANLPDDIPGVLESIANGTGMPAYTEAVAAFYPDSKWANYSTAYDGGTGGQTGFYNVMLNGNDPIAALSWWEGSCAFGSQMRLQATDTHTAISATPANNYRYYIGTGSRHTMYGSNKVYDAVEGTVGGEAQTVVDWINEMLAYNPAAPATPWDNVSCTDCGLVLPGDPAPAVIPTPPFVAGGGPTSVEIVCP
ncbi:MAG: hypothetical protein E4H03_06625 [Myxococcales bacterium]|nr:MAG: hypothetical protein E4H03_06625 [Myxococcales bacterium]